MKEKNIYRQIYTSPTCNYWEP